MNKTFITQQLNDTIEQMRYEIDELVAPVCLMLKVVPLDGNDFKDCLSRIEDCAREIVDLVEKYK